MLQAQIDNMKVYVRYMKDVIEECRRCMEQVFLRGATNKRPTLPVTNVAPENRPGPQ